MKHQCKTCYWFKPDKVEKSFGDCRCPLPNSVKDERSVMHENDGKGCYWYADKKPRPRGKEA